METILTTPNETVPGSTDEKPNREADRRINAILATVGLVGAVLALAALVIWGGRSAGGVAIGAALAVLNLWAFSRIGKALVTGGRPARWAALGVFKFLALAGALYLLIDNGLVGPISLMVGYASLPTGITLATLFNKPDDSV